MNIKKLIVAGLLGLSFAGAACAEDRVTLGWGRLFTNDALGDGQDRWHSGGYTVSMVRGYSFSGNLPARPGEILEFRLSWGLIAPSDLQTPPPDDRRYAGSLSFGVHTHFQWQGNEVSLGGDLVATGPQTGIGSFQRWVHERLDMEVPTVLDDQIGNGLHPGLVAEVGRSFTFGPTQARPFVEVRAGVETLVRVGADISFGGFGPGDLMLRDGTTGLRYRGVAGTVQPGVSLVLGADYAHVFDSTYLPDGGAATLTQDRTRVRLGMHWQGQKAAVFYGLAWLSPEFEEQPEGQTVGALSLNLKF